MKRLLVILFLPFIVGMYSAFAKAESTSTTTMAMAIGPVQSIQDLIPKIEEKPREITDTLNRDYDKRIVEVPEVPDDLREVYDDPEFNYSDEVNQEGNVVSRMINSFFRWMGEVFGVEISPFWSNFLKFLVYLLMAAIAIYFIVRLLSKETAQSIIGKANKSLATVTIEETHVEELDLSRLISDSISAGNYRNAIRYLYLEALKSLSASQKIDWDFKKTNSDYYRELKDPKLKQWFKKVSYLYDYVWYGEFEINQELFNKARKQFESLKSESL